MNIKLFKNIAKEKGVKHAVSICIGFKLMSIGQKLQGTTAGAVINKFFKQINKRVLAKNTKILGEKAETVIQKEKKYQSVKKELFATLEKEYPAINKELCLKELKKYAFLEKASDLNKLEGQNLINSLIEGFKKTKVSDLVKYSNLTNDLKNYKPNPKDESSHAKLKEMASKGKISVLKKNLEKEGIEISPFLLEKSFKKFLYENSNQTPDLLIMNFFKDKKEELQLLSKFHEPSEMEKTGERMILDADISFKESKSQSSQRVQNVSVKPEGNDLEERKKELEQRKQEMRKGIDNQMKKNTATPNIVIKDSDLGIEED